MPLSIIRRAFVRVFTGFRLWCPKRRSGRSRRRRVDRQRNRIDGLTNFGYWGGSCSNIYPHTNLRQDVRNMPTQSHHMCAIITGRAECQWIVTQYQNVKRRWVLWMRNHPTTLYSSDVQSVKGRRPTAEPLITLRILWGSLEAADI